MEKQPKQKPEPYGYAGAGFESYSSQRSPQVILDILMEKVSIQSVLDVGCGIGIWSSYLEKKGKTVIGVDGAWVPKGNLRISESNFNVIDITKQFDLKQKFDLVICLEVAEHIPQDSSEILLGNLTRHSDVILFSAAIPGQGGFEHINEQWQSYWVRKFNELGYDAIDYIRPKVWGNEQVKFYYQQNIMLCIKRSIKDKYFFNQDNCAWDIVHPQLYDRWRDPANISLKKVIKNLPLIFKNYLRR